MTKPIEHKHIIIRADVMNPPVDPVVAKEWVCKLVDKIGMKLAKTKEGVNPISDYIDTPGNRGLTVAAIIETSHITLHVWDESKPGLLQLDVYTCSSLEPIDVFDAMEEFDVRSKSFIVLDRENRIERLF